MSRNTDKVFRMRKAYRRRKQGVYEYCFGNKYYQESSYALRGFNGKPR